ncbi:MAG: hypothetical protein ACRDIV_08950 [Ktedonobacteraceae bacterium]
MIRVNVLVEGSTDEPVAKRLLKHSGLEVGTVYGRRGKADLLRRLSNYNQAARFSPWFVVVDLDADSQCPSQALGTWLPDPSAGMRCRIAVRAIESWLMADRESMAQFLGVSSSRLQHNFDIDPNPKETLIDIARHSRNKSIREDIVPRPMSGAKVGPLYVPQLTRFVNELWRPDTASVESESLHRCLQALSTLAEWEA